MLRQPITPFLGVFILLVIFKEIYGHGRLIEPPSRASMWRYGYQAPANYGDNQLYCGGKSRQWERNSGKCGVCGDPWDGPREHEAGGKYALGVIVRHYEPGATMRVVIDLTAPHMGWFEFRMCPNNNPLRAITHECLNQHILHLADGSGTRYYVTQRNAMLHEVYLLLPAGLTCSQCVLQWKYNAGNSWGVGADGKGCVGCGAQEQFYGCSDVAIGNQYGAINNKPDFKKYVARRNEEIKRQRLEAKRKKEEERKRQAAAAAAAVWAAHLDKIKQQKAEKVKQEQAKKEDKRRKQLLLATWKKKQELQRQFLQSLLKKKGQQKTYAAFKFPKLSAVWKPYVPAKKPKLPLKIITKSNSHVYNDRNNGNYGKYYVKKTPPRRNNNPKSNYVKHYGKGKGHGSIMNDFWSGSVSFDKQTSNWFGKDFFKPRRTKWLSGMMKFLKSLSHTLPVVLF